MSRSDPLLPAYLMCGSDRSKVHRAVTRLRQRVVAETGSDLNVSVFDLLAGRQEEVLAGLLDALVTPGLALGTRLLLVLNGHRLKVKERKPLVDYLQDPMPDTCLAVEGEKFADSDALRKAIARCGDVLEFDLPKRYQMTTWAQQRAKAHGLALSQPVAKHMLALCGDLPQHVERLEREIEKLAVYCGGRPATEADVDAVCCADDEARVFDLLDAVGQRDRAAAFRLLETVFAGGDPREDANAVLYGMLRHVRLLERALELGSVDQSTAAKQLGIHPYTAKKLLPQREHWDRRQLDHAFRALAEAEARLRGKQHATLESSGGVNDGDRLVIEEALAEMVGRQR